MNRNRAARAGIVPALLHPGGRDHARFVLASPRRLVPALRRRTASGGAGRA